MHRAVHLLIALAALVTLIVGGAVLLEHVVDFDNLLPAPSHQSATPARRQPGDHCWSGRSAARSRMARTRHSTSGRTDPRRLVHAQRPGVPRAGRVGWAARARDRDRDDRRSAAAQPADPPLRALRDQALDARRRQARRPRGHGRGDRRRRAQALQRPRQRGQPFVALELWHRPSRRGTCSGPCAWCARRR